MPKRSLDIDNAAGGVNMAEKIQRKTERSHEENQERAYIAASRRADRSIEARVQSARMASEIHKKRTGKSFRISEEIVRKEEMYEEEEDDLPRSYRLLGPHMQTSSPDMNNRVEAYLTNRMAMSAYMTKMNDEWRENHINQLFAASFPNLGKQGQRLSQSHGMPAGQPSLSTTQPQPQQQGQAVTQSPISPTFSNVNYHQSADRTARGSMSSMHHKQTETIMSPAALSPQSSHSTIDTRSASLVEPPTPQSDSAEFSPPQSAFTTELPQEMKLIIGGVGMNINNPYSQNMYGQDFMGNDSFYPEPDMLSSSKLSGYEEVSPEILGDETFMDPLANPAPMEDSWDTFIDDNAWGTDQ
jgi:hypothetical protein